MRKHPNLTNEEFAVLGRYIRERADEMGLRDWQIDLMHGPPVNDDGTEDSSCAARIDIRWGKRLARVWVEREFKENPPERQRQFIIHELVHCHFDHLDSLTSGKLRDHVGEIYWQAWHPAYWLMFENAIDAIAYSWAEKMPLIQWPKSK
jgi:hypothetical protein